MATIETVEDVTPITIDKFLGLNVNDTGDTQISLGESGNMDNFYITDDYKLRKMYGYKTIYDFKGKIRGVFSSKVNDTKYLIIAANGHLYGFKQDDLKNFEETPVTPIDIGTLTDDDTRFFEFDKCVYVLNGHEYKKWDGTTFSDVEGYVPCVLIGCEPAGGGTAYESINILTGKMHEQFNGDGETKVFKLTLSEELLSVDGITVDGTVTTDYTTDLSAGTITFTTAPTKGNDNVDIYFTQKNNDRHLIEGMRAGTIYGGDADTRVFLFGNSEEQNRIRYSGVTAEGVLSVEYFAGTSQVDIGPSNFAVTDLIRQYDVLLAVTNRPDAYYLTLSSLELTDDVTTTSLQTYPLNDAYGSMAFAQGQVIENYPVTINPNAIVQWKQTSVRTEKNVEIISSKIQNDINELHTEDAVTMDYQTHTQLWIAIEDIIYIYNYSNKTYSRLKIADDVSHLRVMDNDIYMATSDGRLCLWSDKYLTYDGEKIDAHWEMDFYDFKAAYLRKTMQKCWVVMQPSTKASAVISFITNKGEGSIKKTIQYNTMLLDDVNFGDFTFKVSYNPQPFRLKIKAKKFTNMKILIDNEELDTTATILSLMLKVEYGGESK